MSSFDPFEKYNLFYKYKINITKEELEQIFIIVKSKKFGNQQNTSTYLALNILNLPLLKNIRKQIIDILDNLKLKLDINFAQYYNKLDHHGVHIHPNSKYSGILYLTSEGTPTTFYNLQFESYEQPVEKDTLILFPSHTPHEVKFLTEDENRLVISFNAG